VTAVFAEELLRQLTRVGEVAVVYQDDAVGGVDVERLRLFLARRGALRGVAHVSEADVAQEGAHVAGAKRLAHLSLGLEQVEDAAGLGRRDTRRVLPAMLQQQQRVVDVLIDRALSDNADDSAHVVLLNPFLRRGG